MSRLVPSCFFFFIAQVLARTEMLSFKESVLESDLIDIFPALLVAAEAYKVGVRDDARSAIKRIFVRMATTTYT